MSTMHDTTNLKPYKVGTYPTIEASIPGFVSGELQDVAAIIGQCVTALKALEARLVAGGL